MTEIVTEVSRRKLLLRTVQGFALLAAERLRKGLRQSQPKLDGPDNFGIGRAGQPPGAAFAGATRQTGSRVCRKRHLAQISQQRQSTADHHGLYRGRAQSVDELAA